MHTRSNWDRPEFTAFTFSTHLHCDGCKETLTRTCIDADTEERRAERERLLLELARGKGWNVDDGHRCPMCRARFADGTAPGTSRVTPDDGTWLVAGPVLCRVTGLETRECACSTCSAARRRK